MAVSEMIMNQQQLQQQCETPISATTASAAIKPSSDKLLPVIGAKKHDANPEKSKEIEHSRITPKTPSQDKTEKLNPLDS